MDTNTRQAGERFGEVRYFRGAHSFDCLECGYSTGWRTDQGTVARNRHLHITVTHDDDREEISSPSLDALREDLDRVRAMLANR